MLGQKLIQAVKNTPTVFESFETGTIIANAWAADAGTWTLTEGGGGLFSKSTNAYMGNYSLKCTVPAYQDGGGYVSIACGVAINSKYDIYVNTTNHNITRITLNGATQAIPSSNTWLKLSHLNTITNINISMVSTDEVSYDIYLDYILKVV